MGLFDIKKAIEALHRPGIGADIGRLARNAAPYYLLPGGLAAPPLTIYWSINSVCNLRCKMCDVGMFNEAGTFFKNLRIDRKLHEIDLETFKRVIDEVAPSRPFIAINSTEPLMYQPLAKAIEHCTRHGLQSGVTTGGYTLPKRANELAEAGLSRLSVSIDGSADVHNHIRGRPDSFAHSVDGIEAFAASCARLGRKAEILVNCTITNLNYDRLVDFYESIKQLPVSSINFSYMWFIDPAVAEEHNRLYGERFAVEASCYSEWIDPNRVDVGVLASQLRVLRAKPRVFLLPDFSDEDLQRYFHQTADYANPKGKCLASWFFLQILADGNVIVYTRCHNRPLGNIHKQSIAEIWNGPEMKGWRTFIRGVKKMPMCKRCDLAY
jgi:MoaA/NifB/PqqE/SkfB family radical SAM enzyme